MSSTPNEPKPMSIEDQRTVHLLVGQLIDIHRRHFSEDVFDEISERAINMLTWIGFDAEDSDSFGVETDEVLTSLLELVLARVPGKIDDLYMDWE